MVDMPSPEEIHQNNRGWSGKDLANNPHEACDKAQRVETMFTAIARKYDLNNRIHSLWQDQRWRNKAVKLAQLKGDEDVVDVACGTGDLSMAFYKAGVRTVIGIDFTQAMLDFAVTKASSANLAIEYRKGDAMDLELQDSSADVVSIAFGIRNVQNTKKAFEEFYRVLRPNGRLIVLEFSTPKNAVVRCCNNFYTKKIMPITATLISRDTTGAYKYLPKSIETFAEAKAMAIEIQEVGFKEICQTPQTFGVCTITSAVKR
jgi:demethylmenaquinone methyltransferase / 2-methoxy-6-polyprenyl-1,4-benzoquinol methylase